MVTTYECLPAYSGSQEIEPTDERRRHYSRLFRKFILLTMVCSLLPLLLVGWAIHLHYSRFATLRLMNAFRSEVEHHRQVIDLFLEERSSKLQLIAHTHSREYLLAPNKLSDVFEMINRDYWSITDLGVIDSGGNHLAYIGPYALMDKNYSQTPWFKEVMQKGVFVSDMFLGFRKVPHFIIAVASGEEGQRWILRATIDTDYFRSLVENVRIGRTGEVYLLNRDGYFQTAPRFSGTIMEKAPFPVEGLHEGIRTQIIEGASTGGHRKAPRQIVSQCWLRDPRWLLVVRQDYAEAFAEVNHANVATLVFLHLSALIILIVAVFITRHMITLIKGRDREADQLNRQLLQTGKLAAIGELAAGVAHEINNPLAIILTEKQILLDMLGPNTGRDRERDEQLRASMSQVERQVQRCKKITHSLLRFSRRTRSVIESIDLNQFVKELTELVEREAQTSGIKFFWSLQEDLPRILSDPSLLQQVFLNLITNAVDAHDGKPYGRIHIRTQAAQQAPELKVIVADAGCGIDPRYLDRIFDPFFYHQTRGEGDRPGTFHLLQHRPAAGRADPGAQ